ncbi:MAG TPA: hypothetical protein VFC31_15945 [Candidatus Limnocylindria bacterium]|nr:hypothetical protein [Candidatus Limnocylindria bacterium]
MARRIIPALLALVVGLGVYALVAVLTPNTRGSAADAAPPFVDEAIAQTTSRLDYDVPAYVSFAVPQRDAVAAARAFVGAPNATIHSTRLALHTSPSRDRDLVWVIDIEGMNWTAAGGGLFNGPEARPMIHRAAVLVSAIDGHVDTVYAFVPGRR